MYNFENVEVPSGEQRKTYLKPGMYELKLTNVEGFVTNPSDPKKTPTHGMEFEFTCTSTNMEYDNSIISCRFYITEKAMPRLQYLHNGLFDKPISRTFTNESEIVTYFKSLVPHSTLVKMITGGKNVNGKLYTDLPYMNFFASDGPESNWIEGEFPLNGSLFQKVMTSTVKTIPLNDSEMDTSPNNPFSDSDDSDNPFA